MTTISVIVGSTRPRRLSEKVAAWIFKELSQISDVRPKMLDLRDFELPFFDQVLPPAMPGRPPYSHPEVTRWTAEISQSDGFIFVTPEYNFSVPAVLKNSIEWVYPEWNRKAAAFVSYGGAGGSRAVQQLRLIASDLQLAQVRTAVHLPLSIVEAHHHGRDVAEALKDFSPRARAMLEDLLWWTRALSTARHCP